MRIDDFICLGRTVPETSKKYGVKVCMAGFSPELRSFLRVYPLEIENPIVARSRCVLEVCRNPCDNRPESWKLTAQNRSILDVGSDVPRSEIVRFLRLRLASSIDELNDLRSSLGVLEVDGSCQGLFRTRDEITCPEQGTLFDIADEDKRFGASTLDIAPYLSFFDAAGRSHVLQIREWGVYEWIRKHRSQATQVWTNLQIGDERPTLLVVGNLNHRRNVWIVIKVYKAEVERQMLFDSLAASEELVLFQ